MLDEKDIGIAQHGDTPFWTVTWSHRLPDGTVEEVFCGQASLAREGDKNAGQWVSGHLPLDIGGFATLEEAALALALSRSGRGVSCENCGSVVLTGIEYPYGHPKHYDGVSEWDCSHCGRRWDRFTGEVIEAGGSR